MGAQAHELAIALPAVAHDADARLADLAGDEPPGRQLAFMQFQHQAESAVEGLGEDAVDLR